MISIRRILSFLLLSASLLFCTSSQAFEGDWEAGAAPGAILMPSRDTYGGGAELFARYTVIHGLSINFGAGFYGAQRTALHHPLGLYTLRAGAVYALDVLEWVPGAGLHLSALFSEDKKDIWHDKGKGLGLDFDLFVQYRGFRQLGIGLFFTYHLVFTGPDYMTTGLSFSWHSDSF